MEAERPNPGLSKALLGGLFAGLIAALVNMIFIIVFRQSTHYAGFEAATALIIFTFFPFLLLLLGGLYYVMVRYFRRGSSFFIVVIILVTALLLADTVWHVQFRGGRLPGKDGLLMGSTILTGLAAALLIPYLIRHSRIYQ